MFAVLLITGNCVLIQVTNLEEKIKCEYLCFGIF